MKYGDFLVAGWILLGIALATIYAIARTSP